MADPFERFELLAELALARDKVLKDFALELPTNEQKRAQCVEQAYNLVGNPQLICTFQVVRTIDFAPVDSPLSLDLKSAIKQPTKVSRVTDVCRPTDFEFPDYATARVKRLHDELLDFYKRSRESLTNPLNIMSSSSFDMVVDWPEEICRTVFTFILGGTWPQWPQAPGTWCEAMSLLETDPILRRKLSNAARTYFPHRWVEVDGRKKLVEDDRCEELVVEVRRKLFSVTLSNCDKWYQQHRDDKEAENR